MDKLSYRRHRFPRIVIQQDRPMTQGKIERRHQTLKNRVLLENYYLPGNLEEQIETFMADYNHRRYHESIDNLTPQSCCKEKGSNARRSPNAACSTDELLPVWWTPS